MVKVEDEWERELGMESAKDLDLLFVNFDSQKVSLKKIQQTIADHGFQSELQRQPAAKPQAAKQ